MLQTNGLALFILAAAALSATVQGKAASLDDDGQARAILSKNGLSPIGPTWATSRELQLRRTIDSLDGLEKRCQSARQRAKAMLKRNEAIRLELQKAEAAKKDPAAASPTGSAGSETTTPAAPDKSAHDKLDSQKPDVTGLGDLSPLQKSMIELVNARTALMLAVLFIQQNVQDLAPEYDGLRHLEQVAAALQRLDTKARLGPVRDYSRDLQRATAAAELAFTSNVPVYQESGQFRLSVVLNEQIPATFTLALQEPNTLITASLAQSIGLAAAASASQQSYRIGERTVVAPQVVLEKVRIGKFVLANVAAVLLPAEAEDLGSRLGSQALSEFKVELEPRRMSLSLEPRKPVDRNSP
jgi:hypothetical protein